MACGGFLWCFGVGLIGLVLLERRRLDMGRFGFLPNRCGLLSLMLGLACGISTSRGLEPEPFVPVFQHMLEEWEAEPYEVTVHHYGALNDEQRAAVERLQDAQRGTARHPPANLAVRLINHADAAQAVTLAPDEFPWLAVRYPSHFGMRAPIWQGELALPAVERLLQSPARALITDAVTQGKAGAWVFLPSGDESVDAHVRADLEKELDRIAHNLAASGKDAEHHAYDSGATPGLLDVRFAIIEVDREDPAEEMLVQMLLHTEPDLRDLGDQPMVFPVYGRGLVLYALVGRGIHAHTLRQAVEMLVQDCATCQPDMMASGVELLLSANWAERLRSPVAP